MRRSVSVALAAAMLGSPALAQFTFSSPTPTPLPLTAGYVTDWSLAVGDLDGGNGPDVVAARANVSTGATGETWIGLNNGSGAFTWSASVAGVGPNKVALAHLDSDPYPDLILSGKTGAGASTMSWWLNDGAGGFSGTPDTHTFTAGEQIKGVVGADLDGDGDQELVVRLDASLEIFEVHAGSPITLTHPTGFTPYAEAGAAINADRRAVVVKDFTGDGKPDIWTYTGHVYENRSTGTGNYDLAPAVRPAHGGNWFTNMAAGDLDGDCLCDLVYAFNPQCCSDPAFVVQLRERELTPIEFGDPQELVFRQGDSLEVADFDRDGRGELLGKLATSGVTAELRIYQVSRAGVLDDGATHTVVEGVAGSLQALAVANFDNDAAGQPDLFVVKAGQYQVRVNTTPVAPGATEIFAETPWTSAAPNRVYVDAASTVSPPDGSPAAPYRTISSAVAAAALNDVILVYPGTYSIGKGETNPILATGVEIVAVAGAEHTRVYGVVFDLVVAKLTGFTLYPPGDHPANDALVRCRDSTVTNNILRCQGGWNGFRVRGTATNRIGSNIVYGASRGIWVEETLMFGVPSVEIVNNTAVDNSTGIEILTNGPLTVTNNLVVDNFTHGIALDCSTPSPVFISDNLVADNGTDLATLTGGGGMCPTNLKTLVAMGDPVDGSTWDSTTHFVDPAQGDYHLVVGGAPAPWFDSGDSDLLTALWLGTDIDGSPRSSYGYGLSAGPCPAPARPDIGADEVGLRDGSDVELALRVIRDPSGMFALETDGVPTSSAWASTTLWCVRPANVPFYNTHFLADAGARIYDAPTFGPPVFYDPSMLGIGARLYFQTVVVKTSPPACFDIFTSNAAVFTRLP